MSLPSIQDSKVFSSQPGPEIADRTEPRSYDAYSHGLESGLNSAVDAVSSLAGFVRRRKRNGPKGIVSRHKPIPHKSDTPIAIQPAKEDVDDVPESRLGLIMDAEGIVCDLRAVAIREELVKRLTGERKTKRYDHKAGDIRDLHANFNEPEAVTPEHDRRSIVLAKLPNGFNLEAWVEKRKGRLFGDDYARDLIDTNAINIGLAVNSLKDVGTLFIPLITSVKTGVGGECHIVLAADAETDSANYNNRPLNKLLESQLAKDSTKNVIAIFGMVQEIMSQNPELVHKQIMLESVIRQLQELSLG